MFVKDTCPFCARVKKVFDKIAMPYCAISLTDKMNGQEIQDTLGKMTGANTVANRVFAVFAILHKSCDLSGCCALHFVLFLKKALV